jgi:hypothetical protein
MRPEGDHSDPRTFEAAADRCRLILSQGDCTPEQEAAVRAHIRLYEREARVRRARIAQDLATWEQELAEPAGE